MIGPCLLGCDERGVVLCPGEIDVDDADPVAPIGSVLCWTCLDEDLNVGVSAP